MDKIQETPQINSEKMHRGYGPGPIQKIKDQPKRIFLYTGDWRDLKTKSLKKIRKK